MERPLSVFVLFSLRSLSGACPRLPQLASWGYILLQDRTVTMYSTMLLCMYYVCAVPQQAPRSTSLSLVTFTVFKIDILLDAASTPVWLVLLFLSFLFWLSGYLFLYSIYISLYFCSGGRVSPRLDDMLLESVLIPTNLLPFINKINKFPFFLSITLYTGGDHNAIKWK